MHHPLRRSFAPQALQVAVLCITFLLTASDASAYIDPGAGSLVYQTLLMILLGAGVVFRHAVGKVLRVFRLSTKSSEKRAPDA